MYTNSVVPLYIFDSFTKKYHSIGTGTLVRHLNKDLLVSAAHVFAKFNQRKTFIFISGKLYEIGGYSAYLWPGHLEQGEKDPIDLGVMQLPSDMYSKTHELKFVTEDEYNEGQKKHSAIYQAIGFPGSKNSRLANKTARKQGEFLTTLLRYTVNDVGVTFFPHEKFDSEFHISVCLTQKGVEANTNIEVDIPEIKGLSGGILQKVIDYNRHTDNFNYAFPAGIIIEKDTAQKAFVAVKLGLLFKWLKILHKQHNIFDEQL